MPGNAISLDGKDNAHLEYFGWVALIVQIVVVVLAIRLYRLKRTRPFALLMSSIICIAVADSVPQMFGFFAGLAGSERNSTEGSTWQSGSG